VSVPRKTLRALFFMAGGTLVFLGFVQSALTLVAWWRGKLDPLTFWDGVWILLLPVLAGVYLRYGSVFRKDCSVCVVAEENRNRHGGLGA
jgi:hypothetical protein